LCFLIFLQIVIDLIIQMKKLFLITTISVFSIIFFACSNTNENKKLIIFHAGSLSVPMKEIAEAFEAENPGVEILMEAAGSRECAKKITDLNKECDVMVSADYVVINNLLIPDFADWNIKFAGNEMTVVYRDQSKFSDEINDTNWFEILQREEVLYGRSDPNSDPCGYRAVLTMRLAEKYYKKENLAATLMAKDNNYMRPKETDLLGLLETGAIDYIFLYKSVAIQHKLKYIVLPDSINLKKEELTDWYATVSVDVTGKKPGEVITHIGEPMVYGITQVKNAPNPELAEKFINFMLSEKGMAIIEKNGQPSMIPSFTETYEKIPEGLKSFAKPLKKIE